MRRGEEYDTKANMWSLGVILYEMLWNVFPFYEQPTKEGIEKLMDKIEREKKCGEVVVEFFRRVFVMNPKERIGVEETTKLFRKKMREREGPRNVQVIRRKSADNSDKLPTAE